MGASARVEIPGTEKRRRKEVSEGGSKAHIGMYIQEKRRKIGRSSKREYRRASQRRL